MTTAERIGRDRVLMARALTVLYWSLADYHFGFDENDDEATVTLDLEDRISPAHVTVCRMPLHSLKVHAGAQTYPFDMLDELRRKLKRERT